MNNAKILVIDDDELILRAVKTALERERFEVTTCNRIANAKDYICQTNYDVIVLDLLMPDLDGFEFIRELRSMNIFTPIIIISGKEEEYNKILGLGLGADDYLTKPFSIHLLISKIKAFIRRNTLYHQSAPTELSSGPFVLNYDTLMITKNGQSLDLTSKERLLLKFLLENPNKVFSKEQLYSHVWNDSAIDDNTIMVYVKRLRNKIEEDPKSPKYLLTVWGIGYQFQT
ncbi:DNA-binding response regulator [Lachnospiraceae bacterium KM106-2]|nr:DNA-binding response regulator [Lachnospiraceae bacterium KM106-2]